MEPSFMVKFVDCADLMFRFEVGDVVLLRQDAWLPDKQRERYAVTELILRHRGGPNPPQVSYGLEKSHYGSVSRGEFSDSSIDRKEAKPSPPIALMGTDTGIVPFVCHKDQLG
jgi:hypothetical protein